MFIIANKNMTRKLCLILLLILIGSAAHAQYINGAEPSEEYAVELAKAQSTYRAGTICVGVGGIVAVVSYGTMLYLINSGLKEISGLLLGTENASGMSAETVDMLDKVAVVGPIVGAAAILTGTGLIAAGSIKTNRINKRLQNELPSPELAFNVSPSSFGFRYSF